MSGLSKKLHSDPFEGEKSGASSVYRENKRSATFARVRIDDVGRCPRQGLKGIITEGRDNFLAMIWQSYTFADPPLGIDTRVIFCFVPAQGI